MYGHLHVRVVAVGLCESAHVHVDVHVHVHGGTCRLMKTTGKHSALAVAARNACRTGTNLQRLAGCDLALAPPRRSGSNPDRRRTSFSVRENLRKSTGRRFT